MTYQRPAYEEVTIAHGGNTVTLRPSLRAAATLEQRYGLPALERAVAECNLTIISEIILVSSRSGHQSAAALLFSLSARPLSHFFDAVQQPIADLVAMFAPASVQSLDTAPRTSKELSPQEVFTAFYEKATGWLGWTPEQAWNATPTEIDRAFAAHFAKLKAIHGSADSKDEAAETPDPEQAARNAAEGLDPEFDRAGLHALKFKIASN